MFGNKIHDAMFAAVVIVSASAFADYTHTVTFRRLNGTVLEQIEIAHGSAATAPTAPTEADFTFAAWDGAEKLVCVTNDVTCWALYESSAAKSPSTSLGSSSIAKRDVPYSLDEYFQLYDNLAWSDEFSGNTLSVGYGKNWGYDTEQRNNELQKYTTTGGNHIVSDGTLKLRVQKESSGGKSFTSGSVTGRNKVAFRYGRCEIRAKLTKSLGTWPAFWLMGNSGNWPNCGELDVFEQVNGSEWISGNFHFKKPGTSNETIQNSALVTPEDGTHWSDGFHRIGIIINEFECAWYVDDHIFKRMDVRDSKYDTVRNQYWYVLLNLAFGGNWPGQLDPNDSKVANFVSEDFEIDYCRIFTNTTADKTIARAEESAGATLSGPVKATVWRGNQLSGTSGNGYTVPYYVKTAIGELFRRDGVDIVTFLTNPNMPTGSNDLMCAVNTPGKTAVFLSANGNSGNSYDDRVQLLAGVMFDKNRFSSSRSAVSTLELSSDPAYSNCVAVCADLVENKTGAKVKVFGVNVITTNGYDYANLFTTLNAYKDEKVIVLFQGMNWAQYSHAKKTAAAQLQSPYALVGDGAAWPYHFVYATENFSASAAKPATLAVPVPSLTITATPHTPAAYSAEVAFNPDGFADAFNASAYAKALAVTFPGYAGEDALADFPALVKLSTAIDGFSYADFALENGGDLRFLDAGGNLLPHEIDTWDTNGVSTVWVKVPLLTAETRITAYYGCANPVRPSDGKVWDDDYVGVWHLGERALPLHESSGASSDFAYSTGKTVAYGADGVVGGAVDIAGGASNAVVAADHDALDGFSKFTFEAWTKQSAHKTNAGILGKRKGTYGSGMSYYLYDSDNRTKFCLSTNGTSVTTAQAIRPTVSGNWLHQVYAVDMTTSSDNAKGYLDGTLSGTGTVGAGTIFATTANLILGNLYAGAPDYAFNGQIDEVRISKCVRSADWIKATHDTIADNATFSSYAMTEPVSAFDKTAFSKSLDIRFSGYAGSSALTDFPALVKLSTAIDGFSYSDFQLAGGGDLRFTDSDGNLIPHEIDTWDESGMSTVWVRVPSLTAATTITAYYGYHGEGVLPAVDSTNVWANGYVGVWHMKESDVPIAESSGVSTPISHRQNNVHFGYAGAIGAAVDCSGATSWFDVLRADDDDDLNGFTAFTLEMWTKQAEGTWSTSSNAGMIEKRPAKNSETAGNSYYWYENKDKAGAAVALVYTGSAGTTRYANSNTGKPEPDVWTHQAFVRSTGTDRRYSSYVAGTNTWSTTSASDDPVTTSTSYLIIGGSGSSVKFPGQIDEVRISNVARSADWIKATHDTVMKSDFATVRLGGTEQSFYILLR